VQSSGCRVQGAGCRVRGAGCRVQGAGCRVQGAGQPDVILPQVHVLERLALEHPGEQILGPFPVDESESGHDCLICAIFARQRFHATLFAKRDPRKSAHPTC